MDQLIGAIARSMRRADEAQRRAYERRWQLRSKLTLSAVGLVVLEMIVVVVAARPSLGVGVLLVLLALGLALAALAVGWRTQGFALFGAAVFLAVLLFGTITTIARTHYAPRVQAVAVLRSGPDPGVTGYYIAETADRVYVARIRGRQVTPKGKRKGNAQFEPSTPRIVVLPRSSVVGILIGPSQSLEDAYAEGGVLRGELCAEKVREAAAASASATHAKPNPCPPA